MNQLTGPGRTDLADESDQADPPGEPVDRPVPQLFEHRRTLRPRYRPGRHLGAGDQLQQAGKPWRQGMQLHLVSTGLQRYQQPLQHPGTAGIHALHTAHIEAYRPRGPMHTIEIFLGKLQVTYRPVTTADKG